MPRPKGYAEIHQSLLTGLLSGIAQRGERHEYKGAGGISLALWPGSGLFRRAPKWIMAAEIVETNKRYARMAAEVDVEWIETAGEMLFKHTYSDPHWSSKAAAAMVYRRSTLYGLTIVSGRRMALAPIDPTTARSMLIEHGLVAGDWRCNEEFYRHNQELIADINELAQRTRSREYIVDRFHLANFYNARLPEEVYDLNTLRAWLRRHRGSPSANALELQPHDLLRESEHLHSIEESFPNTLTVGATELPLAYHFEPGHAQDGVTLTVPQAALRQISDEALGWLVPGMLEEKILAIIKGLPKSLRTNFVPAPDVAKKLAGTLAGVPRDQPFSVALSHAMSKYAGERMTAADLLLANLPEHMQFLVQVVDDEGHVLGAGRNVQQLIAEFGPASELTRSTGGQSGDSADGGVTWANRPVTASDFAGLPPPVTLRRGGVLVAAFPALVDLGDHVELQLADSEPEARKLTRRGLTRLFAIKHHRSLRSHVAHLPEFSSSSVQLNHLLPGQELAKQLQDLIVRIALVESQPDIVTGEDFEARNARATEAISIAAQAVAAWLPKLATQVHALRLRLEQAPNSWQSVTEDIQRQVDRLLGKDFLASTDWDWLSELPRYLAAAQQRMEKLKNGGVAKDVKLFEPIAQAESKLEQLRQSSRMVESEFAAQTVLVRWMLEELRVSIFAQQLRTKHSVSPKRIAEMLKACEA
ncbi:MAG: DUF3418 domain-containing protein [Pirellulaceae bacterium]